MTDEESFYLPTGEQRAPVFARVIRTLNALAIDQQWHVTIKRHRPTRSHAQNALMWVLFDQVLKKGGLAEQGFERDDVHDYLCGERFGWIETRMLGRKKLKPARGTSGLNKQEFSDFIDWIVRFMADKGITLELPEDHRGESP